MTTSTARMTLYHLTHDPEFRLDPTRTVIGYGPKNHAPCEAMTGVLYVSPAPDQWTSTVGYGAWDERRYVAEITLADDALPGIDYVTLSDRETLILNLSVVAVAAITDAPSATV